MKKLTVILFNIIILFSCAEKQAAPVTGDISTSIAPLAYFTERITGNDFKVSVLVPAGSSPETYEPTAMQMKQVSDAKLFINTGLIDFEKNLNRIVPDLNPEARIVNLSDGMYLIEGEHEHDNDDHDTEHTSAHHHGTDPHIWTTPSNMKIIARKIYAEISVLYPDSTKYAANYADLLNDIDSLDSALTGIFEGGQRNFLIYHPALSYLARDYDLNQIAIEYEGKEPSAEYIKSLIDVSKLLNINKILYQIEFSKNTVDALSRELDIETAVINPLAYEIIDNMLEISTLIAE